MGHRAGGKGSLEKDNGALLIVAPHDPGFGNWIDTAGHHQGTMLLRWIGADDHPIPETRIIPLDDRP